MVWDAQKGLIAVRQFSADGAREDYLDPVMLRRKCVLFSAGCEWWLILSVPFQLPVRRMC